MNEIPFSPFWITVPLGLLMFGYLVYWKITSRSTSNSPVAPVEGYIPIYEASTRLYEDFPRKFILERARQELVLDARYISNDSKAERLKLAAKYIASKIPIHGKNSSKVLRRIQNMNNMVFNDDLTCLEHIFYPSSSDGKYTEIAVKSDEFDAFLVEEARHQGFQEESSKV